MPGYNGLGPQGMGTMTGHGGGYCMTFVAPGAVFAPGFCRGAGRGRRHWDHATGLPRWARRASADPLAVPQESSGQVMEIIKEQVACLGKSLEQLNKRITELESEQG